MSRFQFRLRPFLMASTVNCLMLGGYHLLKAYGQYVNATAARSGDTILVKGRLVCPLGPPELGFYFCLDGPRGYGFGSYEYIATRSWFGIYDVTAEIKRHAPFDPGQYVLALATDEKWHESATRCNITVEAP